MRNQFLLIIIIAVAVCGFPEKAISQIRSLPQDSTASGTLFPAGKIDTFRIVSASDGQINLTLTSTNATHTWVTLLDKDTATVLNSTYTDGTVTLATNGLAAGTYFVRLYSYYNNLSPTYTLKYTQIPPLVANDIEPNNTTADAKTLSVNSTTTGHVGYYYNGKRDSADWYKVTTNADGRLQFKMTSENGTHVWVYLYDNDGTTQLNASYSDATLIQNTDGLAAGTYYIKVNCFYNNLFAPYTLTDSLFIPAQNNDTEPNNNKAQAQTLSVNSTTTGHVGYYYNGKRDSADWYKVTTNADGRLQFKMTSGNGTHVWVYLYDNDGTTQLNASYSDATLIQNTDGLTAGTYYIRINCFYNNLFAPYTLTDSLFIPAQSNDTEPNNNKAQAQTLPLNSTVTGHVGYYYNNLRDSADWYKVTTNVDGMLQFKMTSGNGSHVWVYLYDNDGTTLLNSSYSDATLIQNTDGLAAGTYYIKVNCFYNNLFAPYTLTDSLYTYNSNDPEPNNSPYLGGIIPGNATATGHVNYYYNGTRDPYDWWKINYSDSTGNLKINLTLLPHKIDNSIAHVWLQVYRDTLSSPIYNQYTNALTSDINFSSLSKGDYYFKVFTFYDNQFSAYSITPYFITGYINASISLLSAIQGSGCNDNILTYKLGGSTSPYTPYTVKLYRNNILYDSAVVNKDTVTFKFLPDGIFYAKVFGFGAPAGVSATSATSQFTPVSPTPVPTDIPIITKSGRLLRSSAHASRETYQWYRNGLLISGANDSTYLAGSSGSYTARFANACGIGAVSNVISFSGDYQTQTITFQLINDRTYGDPDFVLNATASSGLPVEFIVISGPGSITGNQLHINGAGIIVVEARQQGDDNYGIAPPVQRSFTVSKVAQTITFENINDRDYNSAPFNLSASSTSGLAVVYSVVSGNSSISGNTVTLTGVGTVTIRASQAGDSNYLAATPINRSFCISVNKLNPVTGPAVICPSKSATYSVDNIAGAIYTWRIAGGSTLSSTTNTVTVTWPSTGTYTLIVNAAGNCGAPSKNDSLTITAIATVLPDSVQNMLPANGTPNLQLPLTLSWIPANPGLYYSYDIYLWRADQPQPSTPYVANVTSVNYIVPLTSGLVYNINYKWMVVAHNGSCITINTGPVQQFSLIPLPDLQVYNVAAPATAFSGQSFSVNWKVKNNGPGNTQLNQRWIDAIFISKDSILDFTNPAGQLVFPIIPKLVTSKLNRTALNAGEFYSDTAAFTLPVDYSGQLYFHVITNYSPGLDNPVIETTYSNDTARTSTSATITLIPSPDLRVDTIVNPNNAFSGSTINVTYKVKNYGTNANGAWKDKVYISKDPLFNINNAILLKYPNGLGTYYPALDVIISQNRILQQDSFYRVNLPVVVPNFIYGSYFIYVFTDADKQLYEGPNESNNVDHGNLLQVFLTTTPKIVPLNVSAPVNASNTQTVQLKWNDQNQGAYDNIQKNKGHYYVPNGYCQIPCQAISVGPVLVVCYPTPGTNFIDSLGSGSSYWTDKIYISTDSTGFNTANATLLGEAPRGSNYFSSPDGPQESKCLPGRNYVRNPNSLNEFGYNLNTSNAILPNKDYLSNFDYKVPDNMPQGKYYIYVYGNAGKDVYEYPGTPQITRSNAFNVVWPDLTVPTVTAPSTGNSGTPIIIGYTILNTGQGGVFDHYRKDYFYLGNSSTFDASAVLVDSVVYTASVPVNVPQQLSKSIKMPNGISGSKYFFVRTNVDTSFKEITFSNNINSAGAPVTINLSPPPDLIVSSIGLPNNVSSSTGFPFTYTVTNIGAGTASGNWKDSIFISCNSTFSRPASYFVGVRPQQNYIDPAGSYTDSFNLSVPLTYLISAAPCFNNDVAQVYFYVKTNADNGIYETITSNNISGANQRTVTNTVVDHIVTNVSTNDALAVGRKFTVNWTVKNIGLNPNDFTYSNWNDGIYLSTDSVFTGNAILLGYKREYLQLNHDQSYTDAAIYSIPNIPQGSYYLFANTNALNNIPAERNLSNNINFVRGPSGQAIKIVVTNPPAPDIVPYIVSAPASAAVGQPLKIGYTITNNGIGATYQTSWTDDVWLSNSFQAGGLFLNRKYHNGVLQPGQSYTDTVTVFIPISQPQGNYTIVVSTNQDHDLYESNFNNNQAYQYITVYKPAPVDLIVTNINVQDTVALGYPANINWSISNIGNNRAKGFKTDGIYLSKDSTTNTVNDILIGTSLNQVDILPLNSVGDSAKPLIAGVTEGTYFVKVKTDILNNIIETNKQNNTGISNHKIYVTIPILSFNVITPDVLTSNYLYYKLIVPPSLKGKTISVKLVSRDSLVANNQLYVGLGYLPSAARFDYVFDKPNYGNQQVIIETVVDSVYYIAAKGTKQSGGNQNVTFLATVLPFSILNVNSNHGGNTGNVTVQLKGTLFRDSMNATLRGVSGNNTITASKLYFISSTIVYATFNLAGAPLGVYDVSLTKPDNTVATQPSAFTVEKADNGGLLTGDGNNTGPKGPGTSPGCDPGASSGLNSQLQTEIIYPPKVFASWPFTMLINYTNTTNVDIPAQVRILYSVDGSPVALTEAGLSENKTTLYIEFKDSNGPPGVIRAGGSGSITVYGKAPVNGFAHELLHFTLQ